MRRAGCLVMLPALLFVMALVLIAGCTDQPVKNTTPEPGPAIFVDYYRTGGIGGFDDHLVIFENGAAVYSGQHGRGAFIVNENTLDNLRDSFYSLGFTRMNASYPAQSPGADYFTYTITYQNYTVTAEDTGVPLALQPAINNLNDIVAGKANTFVRS